MRLIATLASLVFISLGCSDIVTEVSSKDRAEQYLNERNYDRAISVLSELVKDDPKDHELKILLASAYSGSIGLNVIDSFELFKPLIYRNDRKKVDFSKKIESNDESDKSSDSPEDWKSKVQARTVNLLHSLSDGFSFVFAMPYAESSARRYLVQAILILQQIPESSEDFIKAQHYLILINLTQFLNYAKDSLPKINESEDVQFQSLVCHFTPSIFFTNLDKSLKYLSNAIASFKYIEQNQQRQPSQGLLRLDDNVQNLSRYYQEKAHSEFLVDLGYQQLKKSYCP